MTALILRGDAAHLPLPGASCDMILCSPPYWRLRSYSDNGEHYEGQIGSEETPREFIRSLLGCTREWMRVLKPEGSIFVNLGDSYSAYNNNRGKSESLSSAADEGRASITSPGLPDHVRAKSLYGLPWRYALGCIDELGLILRAEICWSKPNGLPESVRDRVRRSHEQVFHFTKQPRYFTAVDEIREPHQPQSIARTKRNRFAPDLSQAGIGSPNTLNPADACNPLGKLPGSVWSIPSQPLRVPDWVGVDHFAAYPPELCRRIILGWSPSGICTECDEGRRPVSEASRTIDGEPVTGLGAWKRGRGETAGIGNYRFGTDRRLLGYACACTPYTDHPERRGKDFHAGTDRARQGMNDKNGGERYRRYVEELANPRGPVREYDFGNWQPAPARPALVVDPFGGTGTTAMVADVLGRTGISVDRSADYCRLAQWRVGDPKERAKVLRQPKPVPGHHQPVLFGDWGM